MGTQRQQKQAAVPRCCCGASWWCWSTFISLGLVTLSAADANKKCGGISPSLPQCRAFIAQGVCLTPQQKARFLCHIAQEWFNPPSLRAELGSELLGLGSGSPPSRAPSGQPSAESTPCYSAAISVSPLGCDASHEERAVTKYLGSLDTAQTLKEKVNSSWSSDLCLWLVTNFALTKIILLIVTVDRRAQLHCMAVIYNLCFQTFLVFIFLLLLESWSCSAQKTLSSIWDQVAPSPRARALSPTGENDTTPISRLQEGNY